MSVCVFVCSGLIKDCFPMSRLSGHLPLSYVFHVAEWIGSTFDTFKLFFFIMLEVHPEYETEDLCFR